MLTEGASTEYLGVEFANLTYEEVAVRMEQLSRHPNFSYVVTPNVDHVVMLHDAAGGDIRACFMQAYAAAKIRLCDSRVLQLLARMQGIDLQVVTGSDLTALLFERGHFRGKKVAIVGGDDAMVPQLHDRFPELDLVQHIPPLGLLQKPDAMTEIEIWLTKHRVHYVLFAVGSPQSEIIAKQCLDRGNLQGVGMCVGASIEFLLGRKKRAPQLMQKARLEWAFRLVSEPKRLWKRYLVIGPQIFAIALRHSLLHRK
jgi:exopolysaccharide biosynthesis WecB/TagA/CpsF family protein